MNGSRAGTHWSYLMKEKHSVPGILSLILSVLTVILAMILLVIIEINRSRVNQDGDYAGIIKVLDGSFGVITKAFFLISLVFGVVGVVQKLKKRSSAIAALCLNLVFIVILLLLYLK
ncbi:MAG: hypothetical protein ACFFDN_45685 [Candidatus Hodarchaeota archaeon]